MSTAASVRTWGGTVVALLAVAATYPIAVLVHPTTEPELWPLLVALMSGAAARAGAVRHVETDEQPRDEPTTGLSWSQILGLLVVGGAADILLRTLLRLGTGASLDGSLVSGATLAVAGMIAVAWAWGGLLAARMRHAVGHSLQPGDVRSVGRGLLLAGAVVLAAAGGAQWSSPATAWRTISVTIAVIGYVIVALFAHLWLRKAALHSGWEQAGRHVAPAITSRWGPSVLVLLVGGIAVVSLWWSPPVAPVRHTVEHASSQVVAWWQDDVELLTREQLTGPGAVAGESGPPEGATPLDEERREITVRGVLEWLLQPASGFEEGEPLPEDDAAEPRWGVTPQLLIAIAMLIGVMFLTVRRVRRRSGQSRPRSVVEVLGVWWVRLVTLLAALLGRERRQPSRHGNGGQPARHPREVHRRARRRRRPSTPRERIKFDYWRVLDRAERQGLARHPTQSPREYAAVLSPQVGDQADAVEELTVRFVEARYSHHRIDTHAAARATEISRTLRRALKSSSPSARPAPGKGSSG